MALIIRRGVFLCIHLSIKYDMLLVIYLSFDDKGYEHVTFLTPTDFDFESYHVANRVYKKVFGIFYDDVSR